MIQWLNEASGPWALTFWAIVWQSTLVAVLVWLVALALRGSSPAVRYWLWQLVPIKLLVLPLMAMALGSWSISLPWPANVVAVESEAREAQTEQAVGASSPALATKDPRTAPAVAPRTFSFAQLTWNSWLLVGWLAVVLLQLGLLLRQRARLSRLIAQTRPAPAELAHTCGELAAQMKLERVPRLALAAGSGAPFVCGLRRPVLVLPAELTLELQGAELQQVIAHELAHVRRHDLLWGWIPQVARMLYFFHPVAYWASNRIQLERELACDQEALRAAGGDPAEYAQTLVRVVDFSSRPADPFRFATTGEGASPTASNQLSGSNRT